jgi:hypothetical protein
VLVAGAEIFRLKGNLGAPPIIRPIYASACTFTNMGMDYLSVLGPQVARQLIQASQ